MQHPHQYLQGSLACIFSSPLALCFCSCCFFYLFPTSSSSTSSSFSSHFCSSSFPSSISFFNIILPFQENLLTLSFHILRCYWIKPCVGDFAEGLQQERLITFQGSTMNNRNWNIKLAFLLKGLSYFAFRKISLSLFCGVQPPILTVHILSLNLLSFLSYFASSNQNRCWFIFIIPSLS